MIIESQNQLYRFIKNKDYRLIKTINYIIIIRLFLDINSLIKP